MVNISQPDQLRARISQVLQNALQQRGLPPGEAGVDTQELVRQVAAQAPPEARNMLVRATAQAAQDPRLSRPGGAPVQANSPPQAAPPAGAPPPSSTPQGASQGVDAADAALREALLSSPGGAPVQATPAPAPPIPMQVIPPETAGPQPQAATGGDAADRALDAALAAAGRQERSTFPEDLQFLLPKDDAELARRSHEVDERFPPRDGDEPPDTPEGDAITTLEAAREIARDIPGVGEGDAALSPANAAAAEDALRGELADEFGLDEIDDAILEARKRLSEIQEGNQPSALQFIAFVLASLAGADVQVAAEAILGTFSGRRQEERAEDRLFDLENLRLGRLESKREAQRGLAAEDRAFQRDLAMLGAKQQFEADKLKFQSEQEANRAGVELLESIRRQESTRAVNTADPTSAAERQDLIDRIDAIINQASRPFQERLQREKSRLQLEGSQGNASPVGPRERLRLQGFSGTGA